MPSCFSVPKPSQMWYGHVEGRGMGSSFEPAHFCSQYVQPMWSACMQTNTTHVFTCSQQGTFFSWRKHFENTLCAKTPTSEENNERTGRHCKAGLGGKVELCALCTKCLYVSAAWLLHKWNRYSRYLAFNIFSSSRCNLLCVSSSLLSCFLATYSNFQLLT